MDALNSAVINYGTECSFIKHPVARASWAGGRNLLSMTGEDGLRHHIEGDMSSNISSLLFIILEKNNRRVKDKIRQNSIPNYLYYYFIFKQIKYT